MAVKKSAVQLLAPLLEAEGLILVEQNAEWVQFKTKFNEPIFLQNIKYSKKDFEELLLFNPSFRHLISKSPELSNEINKVLDPDKTHKEKLDRAKKGDKVRGESTERINIQQQLDEHRSSLSKEFLGALWTAAGLGLAVVAILAGVLTWGINGYIGWTEAKLSKQVEDEQRKFFVQNQNQNESRYQKLNSEIRLLKLELLKRK